MTTFFTSFFSFPFFFLISFFFSSFRENGEFYYAIALVSVCPFCLFCSILSLSLCLSGVVGGWVGVGGVAR